jgi:glycosyltransferase involved in cell wall biosynthesis
MPTHNRVDLLSRAVQSVIDQTYQNWELIIVNDASTDNTDEYLKSISSKDRRIRYLKNNTSKGACYSRNLAIINAKGKYITGLDDDDYFTNDRIMDFIMQFDERYSFISHSNYALTKQGIKKKLSYEGEINLYRLLKSNIIGNQIFTLTSRLRNVGGFDINMPAWQDYDLWVRLTEKYGSSFKLKKFSYVMDVRHEMGRITISDKPILGCNIFIDKHEHLSPDGLKKIKISRKVLLKERISVSDFIYACDRFNYKGLLKSLLKEYLL